MVALFGWMIRDQRSMWELNIRIEMQRLQYFWFGVFVWQFLLFHWIFFRASLFSTLSHVSKTQNKLSMVSLVSLLWLSSVCWVSQSQVLDPCFPAAFSFWKFRDSRFARQRWFENSKIQIKLQSKIFALRGKRSSQFAAERSCTSPKISALRGWNG